MIKKISRLFIIAVFLFIAVAVIEEQGYARMTKQQRKWEKQDRAHEEALERKKREREKQEQMFAERKKRALEKKKQAEQPYQGQTRPLARRLIALEQQVTELETIVDQLKHRIALLEALNSQGKDGLKHSAAIVTKSKRKK